MITCDKWIQEFQKGKVNEAIDLALSAIKHNPNPRTLSQLANFYLYTRDFTQSQKYFSQAIKLAPTCPFIDYENCFLNFYQGNYQQAWTQFEKRFLFFKSLRTYIDQFGSHKQWQRNTNLKNKKLLIHCEQGNGDVIQFARYLKCIKQKHQCSIILIAYEALRGVLRASHLGVDQIIVQVPGEALRVPGFDYFASVMSLPFLLNMPEPYSSVPLEIDHNHIGKRTLPKGFNIIVCNSGCPNHCNDRWRSCSLDLFRNIAAIPQVNLHILHSDRVLSSDVKVFNWTSQIKNFYNSAQFILGADLVISVDTAILHLAGSLGVETWGILPYYGEWRWGATEETTSWYHSIKFYRQNSLNNWSNVFSELEADLTRKLNCESY